MCHGLNHAVIQPKGGSYKAFTIAGGSRPDDPRVKADRNKFFPEFGQSFFYRLDGIAVVGTVIAQNQFAFLIDKSNLGGG